MLPQAETRYPNASCIPPPRRRVKVRTALASLLGSLSCPRPSPGPALIPDLIATCSRCTPSSPPSAPRALPPPWLWPQEPVPLPAAPGSLQGPRHVRSTYMETGAQRAAPACPSTQLRAAQPGSATGLLSSVHVPSSHLGRETGCAGQRVTVGCSVCLDSGPQGWGHYCHGWLSTPEVG